MNTDNSLLAIVHSEWNTSIFWYEHIKERIRTMKIHTTNSQGQKVLVEYSQTIVKEPESKPSITINDFETFKKCLIEMRKQDEYSGGGDSRYKEALFELNQRDNALYLQFFNRLRKEFRER